MRAADRYVRGAGAEPAGAASRETARRWLAAIRWRQHENIAYDWLAQGGKRSRPFITLAVYDALKGGQGTLSVEGWSLPDSVRRTALAIEAFHKASLVHDDIEDDDTFRYGQETLHRQYGVSTAINVGDYLIGLGYRLVSRERKELGGDCTADILEPSGRGPPETLRRTGGRAALARCRGQDADAAGRAEDLRPQDGAGFRGGPVRRRPPGGPCGALRESRPWSSARTSASRSRS